MKTHYLLKKVSPLLSILRSYALLITFLVFSLNSYAQLANGKVKFLGCTWGSGNEPAQFSSLFNQLTPDNATKWQSCEGTGRNQWNFDEATAQYNYCQSKGIPFKFHCLVWQNQYPSNWVEGLAPADKKVATEEWIAKAAQMFPNSAYVDVVNECTKLNPWYMTGTNPETGKLNGDPVPGYFWDLGGKGASGWDFVIWAFQKARQYFPHAKLLINDYHILNTYGNIDLYMSIISSLKAQGLIDGIGCQSHFLESTSGAEVQSRLDKLATLDLPIYISEFDMNFKDDTQQSNKFAELFTIFWNHPAVKGITLWNYLEGQTWQTYAHLIRSDGSDRPAMTWLRQFMAQQGGTQNIDGYDYISDEYGNVDVPYGTMDLAFGANGGYSFKANQTAGCGCNVASFGGVDPALNQVKKCYRKTPMTSFVLDANYYVNNQPDLKTAFGTNYQAGANHYSKYGINEGRRGAQWFDVTWYLNNNPDLQAAFGINNMAAVNHFLNNGINEGRQSSADFSVKAYLHRYQDLINAFGYTNYAAALQHWINYGKAEGRNGGEATLINGGAYEIEFQTDANKVLDLNGWADYNGGLIAPYSRNGANNQLWRAVDMGGGYWKFESVCSPSKRCIDLNGSNVANQATIDLWDGGSNAWNLQWRLVGYSPNGYFSVVSRAADYNGVNRGWDIYYCDMTGDSKLKLNDLFNGTSSCQNFKFNLKNAPMYVKNSNGNITDILDVQNSLVKIFPNPSMDGNINIQLSDEAKNVNWTIVIQDIQGREVKTFTDFQNMPSKISTTLNPGFYIVSVKSIMKSYNIKIIVK